MNNGAVAGVEPTALERTRGGVGIVEVAFHHE
jgi:hypothetical protein